MGGKATAALAPDIISALTGFGDSGFSCVRIAQTPRRRPRPRGTGTPPARSGVGPIHTSNWQIWARHAHSGLPRLGMAKPRQNMATAEYRYGNGALAN